MVDTYAINYVGYSAPLLLHFHIIKINIASIYYLDTFLHDETVINTNALSQDEYGENEGSLWSDENNLSSV